MTNVGQFRLFYDSQCPICRREIEWLKRRDRDGRLVAEDIALPTFHAELYGLTQDAVERVIHGVMPDGRIVRRMDAIRQAYRAVGLGWVIAPTAWPVIRWFSDRAYDLFARNRVAIGRIFGRSCEGACSRK